MQITNQEKLGKLGEELVAEIFDGQLSENKYDSTKDMLVEGKTVEVKTQNRHPNGSFTIRADHKVNFQKCMSVDHLIFVEYDHSDNIKIYECDERENYNTVTTRAYPPETMARAMICWPISKMQHIKTVADPVLAEQMRSLSNAKAFKK